MNIIINGNLPIFIFIHLITNVILDGEKYETKTDRAMSHRKTFLKKILEYEVLEGVSLSRMKRELFLFSNNNSHIFTNNNCPNSLQRSRI